MAINSHIFKSYDIRGIYPDQLNEEAAYWIGRAFAKRAAHQIVVGRDMRLSSPQLHAELVRGITDQGFDVVDIGLVPIDAVYFAVGVQKHPAGIMITASHNPKEYNGFKMPLLGQDYMDWVRGVVLQPDVEALVAKQTPPAAKKGRVTALDIYDDYLSHVLSFCDSKKIKPLKVVVDAGNGMAGAVMPKLAPHLPIEMIEMNFELDGNFPAHPSNPLLPESQAGITKRVVAEKADIGVIIDGDTDRLFFVDEAGKFIRADLTLLLLARLFLEREPGSGIAYNVICSRLVPEKIKEWGGTPIRSKVGFVNVAQAMRQHGGIMSGELSAHYAFRDNAYADSGFIALVIMLQMLSEDGRPLSQILAEFDKYYKVPETNLKISDAAEILKALKAKYTDGEQDELDGLTVSYPTWWFNVRASQTEPLLRVTLEGENPATIEQKQRELIDFVQKV